MNISVRITDQSTGNCLHNNELLLSSGDDIIVAKLASLALEQSGLKAKGYKWVQVQCKNVATSSIDEFSEEVDFDEPVRKSFIYNVLVVQKKKQQMQNASTNDGDKNVQQQPLVVLVSSNANDMFGQQEHVDQQQNVDSEDSEAVGPQKKKIVSAEEEKNMRNFYKLTQRISSDVSTDLMMFPPSALAQEHDLSGNSVCSQKDCWMEEEDGFESLLSSDQQQITHSEQELSLVAAAAGQKMKMQQQEQKHQRKQQPNGADFLLEVSPYSIKSLYKKALGVPNEENNAADTLGSFYNAKLDSFVVEQPCFYGELEEKEEEARIVEKLNAVGGYIETKMFDQNCSIGKSEMDSRFEQLGVDIEHKISISVGLASTNGYGSFVNAQEDDDNDVENEEEQEDMKKKSEFTLVHVVGTKKRSIKLLDKRVAELLLTPGRISKFQNATHIVHSAIYGVAFCCLFKLKKGSSIDCVNMERVKQIVYKYVKSNYHTKEDWNFLKCAQNHLTVRLFADKHILDLLSCGGDSSSISMPIIEMLEMINVRNIRLHLYKQRSSASSASFEHPLAYEMCPLEQLIQRDYLELINGTTSNSEGVALADTVALVECVKKCDASRQQFRKVLKQFHQIAKFAHCLSEQIFNEFLANSEMLGQQFDQLSSICRQLVKAIRCAEFEEGVGEKRVRTDQFLTNVQTFVDAVREFENGLAMQREKLQYAKYLQEKGVPYVGRKTAFGDELSKILLTMKKSSSSGVYAFFFSSVAAEDERLKEDCTAQQLRDEHFQLFQKLILSGERCLFVDMELQQQRQQTPLDGIPWTTGPRLVKFREDQHPEFTDYLAEYTRKLNTCILRLAFAHTATDGGSNSAALPAPTLIPLQIPCPNFTTCLNKEYLWECDGCSQIVHYDKDTDLVNVTESRPETLGYFYCGCGRTPAYGSEFRCKNTCLHGEQFTAYPFPMLASLLKQLCPQEESTNLLILSETGCGKSTLINSIPNYLTFQSLDDAIENWTTNGPLYLIPSKFMKGTREIRIGEIGQKRDVSDSDTQQTTCHVLPFRGQRFKIFDTPGVCDTAGLEKDEVNFKNIMWSISGYKQLHGILILVKPNSARLTIAFKYCINELLKHLHKDAARNILFCFTNASGTNYEEGDSIPALRRLLAEVESEHGVHIEMNDENTFYFDNEAFRFLSMLHNGIQPTGRAYDRAVESWEMTDPEIRRLFTFVQNLPPHQVHNTVALNEIRRIIITLAQPLARTSQIIMENIALAEEQRNRLGQLDASSIKLQDELLSHEERYVEPVALPYPRTVCTAPSCISVSTDAFGQSTTVFSKHCHPHCYLEGVRAETRADPILRGCSAMHNVNGEIKCHVCGCSWEQHMHTYTELINRTRMVVNPAVESMLKQNMDGKQIIEQCMAEADQRVQQNKREQEQISNIAAHFATYLKQNSIVAHNKYFEDYIKMQMDNARVVAQYTKDRRDDSKVENLQKLLNQYREQRAIIECFSDKSKLMIQAEDITIYLNQLFSLKLNGKQIQTLFKVEEEDMKKRTACAENAFQNKHGVRASRNERQSSRLSSIVTGERPYQFFHSSSSVSMGMQDQQRYREFENAAQQSTSSTSFASTLDCRDNNSGGNPWWKKWLNGITKNYN